MRYERSAALAKRRVVEIERITADLAKRKARIEKLIGRIPATRSGLMLWAYKKVGVNLPHYTGSQYDMGTRISSRDQVRLGDILFFYPDLGHNGMYIGNGKTVHAPRSGKNVEVVELAPYYWSNFVGASRILS